MPRAKEVWLGLIAAGLLAADGSQALPLDYSEPIDLSEPTPRDVLVWFETSPAVAPDDTPDALDANWSSRVYASYISDGFTATVTVPGGGVESAVAAVGYTPQIGTFSDYVFQFDVATGAYTGAFTGNVTINGNDVSWSNSIDSTLVGGYDQMAMEEDGAAGVFYSWVWCTMGMDCVMVPGSVGVNEWTYRDTMFMWKTVSTFSPFGEVVFGKVPEPSTAFLVGFGLVALAFLARRRRSSG